jgi:type 1 glutamine amidotransferase
MTRILIFSATAGYRHYSIDAGVRAVQELAESVGVKTLASESADIFTSDVMSDLSAVVWMQASGTGLLNAPQRTAYERFTENGGGFAGVHAASDAERDWPLFDALVGARFRCHPVDLQQAEIRVEQPGDRSMAGITDPWLWSDEWYAFDKNPRGSVQVIASVAEDSYSPGDAGMGEDHPLVWRTSVGKAKAWYTALGHEASAYQNPVFRRHLWAGIESILSADSEMAAQ